MKNIGLTGSIGSGKTLVCSVFEHLGIPIFNADIQAKETYNDKLFLKEIAEEFGKNVVVDNVLDKKTLADIVFNNKDRLIKLNSMVHPKVLDRFFLWRKNHSAPYVILESAILFEIGWEDKFENIICINSPKEVSIQRAMSRDNVSREVIEERMNNQISIEEKVEKSDFVVYHDNKTMLIPQILEIHKRIIESE
ncbi:MAG TPA: dephospho-CoA kinase [Bacteroidales bacterium]|nr:dephospho-CoA kinase [Bacteroidales bacterium]